VVVLHFPSHWIERTGNIYHEFGFKFNADPISDRFALIN